MYITRKDALCTRYMSDGPALPFRSPKRISIVQYASCNGEKKRLLFIFPFSRRITKKDAVKKMCCKSWSMKGHPSSHNQGSQKMGPTNTSYLSNRDIFHFHVIMRGRVSPLATGRGPMLCAPETLVANRPAGKFGG